MAPPSKHPRMATSCTNDSPQPHQSVFNDSGNVNDDHMQQRVQQVCVPADMTPAHQPIPRIPPRPRGTVFYSNSINYERQRNAHDLDPKASSFAWQSVQHDFQALSQNGSTASSVQPGNNQHGNMTQPSVAVHRATQGVGAYLSASSAPTSGTLGGFHNKAPEANGSVGMSPTNDAGRKSTLSLTPPRSLSPDEQALGRKRKAEVSKSAPKAIKAPKKGAAKTPGVESRKQPSTKGVSRRVCASGSQSKRSEAKKPQTKKTQQSGGGDGNGSPGKIFEKESRPREKPLRNLREIIQKLLQDSGPHGLDSYAKSGRQFYIRVGTLCSGTDAPVHVMNLFGMLKNSEGKQVFTTINSFACEIEPFKQGFLMRNSKPELLFRDARDFAKGNAQKAHLVTGVEVDIPEVDLFVAGTSCVDFSSLSTSKVSRYVGLEQALKDWAALKKRHGPNLSRQHLSEDDWYEAIKAMVEETQAKNTSTKTFASAMNYIKARKPKIVITENVESAPWESMVSLVFPLIGYAATVHKVDTKYFHLPQTRSRKYLIAFSHEAFTLGGAQMLCELFDSKLKNLKHLHSNTVMDFLLTTNSIDLHRARNEMEISAQAVREREASWSFSKSRHTAFRRAKRLPELRPWIRWKENASSNAPANMWHPWENRQPCRVRDVLDCLFLLALYGRELVHGPYDLRHKAQIIDCSQNVDRISSNVVFGRTGCLTPNAISVLTLDARPITGSEALRLQGLPIENFDMSVETQTQLQDLAGNAMTTTVVGAVILAALSSVAHFADEEDSGLLTRLFQQGDYTPKDEMGNSFHSGNKNIGNGSREAYRIKLYAHLTPQARVQEILDVGQRARQRCVCHHDLAYSSIELHECAVCGASFCKSCKGNPDHALAKSPQSYEDLKSLPHAQAECEIRKYFPPMLWMISEAGKLAVKLEQALVRSNLNEAHRSALANAVIQGLCQSTYELQFVEITDAVRLEYTAKQTFILRVIMEKNQIIWYLHIEEWSEMGCSLSGALTTAQPIARAVLGPEDRTQFPGTEAWEFWVPHKVLFSLKFEVQNEQSLCLTEFGDLGNMPDQLQASIKELQGSVWTFHPECGFAENALWTYSGPLQKLFLFKDVLPVGPAGEDCFVISSTSRLMGRVPNAEVRPVLLRIPRDFQIHRQFKEVLLGDGDFLISAGEELPLQGVVDGWWDSLAAHSISVGGFPNMDSELVGAIPKDAPVSILRPGPNDAVTLYDSCYRYQDLLTVSLPILESHDATPELLKKIQHLDLAQQLDFSEFTRLIGPLYSAVEMAFVATGRKRAELQKDVVLSSDCQTCAPELPEMFFVKKGKPEAAALTPFKLVVARHREADMRAYEQRLKARPQTFRVDHNLTSDFSTRELKMAGASYIDVRFVAHGHAMLQQARGYLPRHPPHYEDTNETTGTFAMEFGVIEEPRGFLPPLEISAPAKIDPNDARHPSGFQNGLHLFKEQLDSLQWMLSREELGPQTSFVEKEVKEVYLEPLRLRIYANANRRIVRRGRVVADNVGFGKTALCLGLIDVQHETDRKEFLDMRRNNDTLDGLVHIHATLVIVPNQLTQQWKTEAERFLNPKTKNQKLYNIIMLQTFQDLQRVGLLEMKKADIIICSNKVFADNKYQAELSKYCQTNDIGERMVTLQKVYQAWYKNVLGVLGQMRAGILRAVQEKNNGTGSLLVNSLRQDLLELSRERRAMDGGLNLSFLPWDPDTEKAETEAAEKKRAVNWQPLLLMEQFSYSRVIWDEFPYENFPVTEFVANCATTSKWMLSGTPPLENLDNICTAAYLFNVHIARPLQLVKGRQPSVCEHEPMAPHSTLELTTMYQSRHSPHVLEERHNQAQAFVQTFMRKNDRKSEVTKVEKPLVLTSSALSTLAYAELEQELRRNQYNANHLASDTRQRLMSRLGWRAGESGRERSVEALMIRASASSKDTFAHAGGTGGTDAEAAQFLCDRTIDSIAEIENRGRELFAKAFFLAYRLVFITISNTAKNQDGQEDRQLNYYQSLVDLVESILQVNMNMYGSWNAFESAMRILIWDGEMQIALGMFRYGNMSTLRKTLRSVFDGMSFCDPPTTEPVYHPQPQREKLRVALKSKLAFLNMFREWLTKTPLHSRRWFLTDTVNDPEEAEEELLKLEWENKVTWEEEYRTSSKNPDVVVPISELREPPGSYRPDDFDFEKLKSIDLLRREMRDKLRTSSTDKLNAVRASIENPKDTKTFWAEECSRRGLVSTPGESKEIMAARIAAHEEKIATDADYVSPEACGLALSNYPQQGKRKIRGGNMEVIFDDLMQTVDSLTGLMERLVVAHGKLNLQLVCLYLLEGRRICRVAKCSKHDDEHWVSLVCGHVRCEDPDDSALCGVDHCSRPVTGVSVKLSNIRQSERVVTANRLAGGITEDPLPYLNSDPPYRGSTMAPKARAVINLIKSTKDCDQVVVFVQCPAMEKDIYCELAAAGVQHVPGGIEERGEAMYLEKFKKGQLKVLVQTINSEQAAGSNLHNANHVIFVSPLVSHSQESWDAHMKQALGRCVRFRQEKTVYVYHMVMDTTIEVDILEWRRKQEVLVTKGQAVGDFNKCSTGEFLARCEGDSSAVEIQMASDQGRAISMLTRDDVQYLMGDDFLSLASVKAFRTVDQAAAEKNGQDNAQTGPADVDYLTCYGVETECEDEGEINIDVDMGDA